MEIWKPVSGYEGYYEVNNYGQVKSLARVITQIGPLGPYKRPIYEKILTPTKINSGYLRVNLRKPRESVHPQQYLVHVLVAGAFCLNPDGLPEVNHKDGIKTNNRADNLEWITPGDNMRHAYRIGLSTRVQGERHPKTTLTEADVISIKINRDRGSAFLAEKFNVRPKTIKDILIGRTWKHISPN